jgi:diguanylate cyclase (GGDEF)-like protein
MSPASPKLRADWLPAVSVMVVMLLAGSRLVMLSVQQHAAQARESAQAFAGRYGRAIESQLQDLIRSAHRQSQAKAPFASPEKGRKGFWLTGDGIVVKTTDSDATTRQAIASEWAASDSQEGAATARLLGPIRHGSQWIVAARVRLAAPNGWSIVYQDLNALLSSTDIRSLVSGGYDFEILQRDAASHPLRVLASSDAARLAEPVMRTIHPLDMTIAVRPRAGWYPTSVLVTDIGLLLLITWLLTFGVYDMTRNSTRLRAVLDAAKRHMQALNQRLMQEIEQRQSLQKSFDHARYHDAFTGLPNRGYFMVQLERALRELRTRRRQRIAIVLIDIDRFKLINDTLGHTAGDEVMMQAARRFKQATAAFEGVLARWGGDQFAVLLFDVHSSDTAIGLARLLQESLRAPFELRKHRVSIGASVGVTSVDAGLQRAEEVVREADIALSVAKSKEGARVVAYDPAMGGDVLGLVSLEADLHVALEREELRLLFQPIVDLRANRIAGAEALLRWQHPVEGLLTPDKFLAIAEEAGLIVPITYWTIERVCRLAGEWHRRVPPGTDFFISINLSAAALRDPRLVDYIAKALEETGTPPRALRFELTESGLISNIGAASEILERLHRMGIQLILDDFGTGYSSLNHLQLFPFDYVKIDRPLAKRIGPNQPDNRIMCAMVQMVSSLGLKAIAEVVETEAGALALEEAGCEFGQGFFFCEPVESEEALRRLRNRDYRMPRGMSAQAQAPAPVVTSAQLPPPADPIEPLTAISTHDSPEEPSPYDSPTQAVPLEALALPIDDSPTIMEPDSPTLVEPTESFPSDAADDDSATLADAVEFSVPEEPTEPDEPNASNEPPSDSEKGSDSPEIRWRRPHRAG